MSVIAVAFMAPTRKWWPYHMYNDLVNFINKNNKSTIKAFFFSTKKEWISLHFRKFDCIVSAVPFLFKPLFVNKVFINIHWNFKEERKKITIWKLPLYLMEWNIKWSTIIVSSKFIPHVTNISKPVIIIENFVQQSSGTLNEKIINQPIQLLTVSSTKFREKASWIVDLAKSLVDLWRTWNTFVWTIVAWWNKEIYANIKHQISLINIPKCCTIKYYERKTKDELKMLYSKCDIFLYWTRLDTRWITIMEAMIHGLPVVLLPYEAWKYIYPEDIITSDVVWRIEFILSNFAEQSMKSRIFANQFTLKKLYKKWVTVLDTRELLY